MFWLLCFVSSKVRNTKLKTSLHKTQCPNGDKLKEKVVNENRTIVQVYSHRHFYRFLFMSPSRRLTTQDTKHKSQNTKLESQMFETQNSKHPFTKHNVPVRLPYCALQGRKWQSSNTSVSNISVQVVKKGKLTFPLQYV